MLLELDFLVGLRHVTFSVHASYTHCYWTSLIFSKCTEIQLSLAFYKRVLRHGMHHVSWEKTLCQTNSKLLSCLCTVIIIVMALSQPKNLKTVRCGCFHWVDILLLKWRYSCYYHNTETLKQFSIYILYIYVHIYLDIDIDVDTDIVRHVGIHRHRHRHRRRNRHMHMHLLVHMDSALTSVKQ